MKWFMALAVWATGLSSFAQVHVSGDPHAHAHAPAAAHAPEIHRPYAGMQKREVAAFSEQQVRDIRDGKGMGMALPAELKGYPGPVHVLELSGRLALSDQQVQRTRLIHNTMQAEAVEIGEKWIAAERAIDAMFDSGVATPGQLEELVQKSAYWQGQLRNAHLRHHVTMAQMLTKEQIALYRQLRGYR